MRGSILTSLPRCILALKEWSTEQVFREELVVLTSKDHLLLEPVIHH